MLKGHHKNTTSKIHTAGNSPGQMILFPLELNCRNKKGRESYLFKEMKKTYQPITIHVHCLDSNLRKLFKKLLRSEWRIIIKYFTWINSIVLFFLKNAYLLEKLCSSMDEMIFGTGFKITVGVDSRDCQ